MTDKVVQDGKLINYTCTGNVTKSYLYSVGVTGTSLTLTAKNGMPVVATRSGTTGDNVPMLTEGVFTLTKMAEAASSLVKGQQAYWRTTGGQQKLTGVATGADGVAGTAWAAAVTGATTAEVKLLGSNAVANAA